MWEKFLAYILQEHRGKTMGIVLGLIASIIFITYGFWRALFVIFCVIVGYIIGKKIDENKSFDSWLKQMFKEK